jgi:Flp pilus assembly protein TadB
LHNPVVRRRAAAASVGVCTTVFLGGLPGVVIGLVAAAGVHRQLARRLPAAERHRRQRMAADLPIAADLMSACLLAGATPVDAATAVAAALPGPLGDELRSTAAAIRLGGDPGQGWAALANQRELAPLARALSHTSGAPLAERIAHVADECRERRRGELTAAARRTAVRATLPLGACFLPAFLLLGVAPVVIGLATPLLP